MTAFCLVHSLTQIPSGVWKNSEVLKSTYYVNLHLNVSGSRKLLLVYVQGYIGTRFLLLSFKITKKKGEGG